MKVNLAMPKLNPTSEELAKAFGERVRELRTKRGDLSQERLADEVGVHRSFIGRVERGETNITLANLFRICSGLGVSLSEFFQDFEMLLPPR
jgi:transcriptional regulator with XRE-family HTH domain